ncbi:DNA/RNA helicase domain-containing protein [Coralloluteibacterium thermophilus]|uniref:DNA/RNA helicase domain-containing protein n=1 Tax=Coralloluteibacterium thermophilum TaxID=2707049 RepID=UPI0036703210
MEEVGCIHTCQGLELDYVGVIIGPDLRWIDGKPRVFPESRSRMDRSIRGYKTLMKQDPDATRERVDRVVRNTYKTLMGPRGRGVMCGHFNYLSRPKANIANPAPRSNSSSTQIKTLATSAKGG